MQGDWNFTQKSFSNLSGNLLFVPHSSTVSNPSRMLLDDVELICEYGYLNGISSQIIKSTKSGYDYKFVAHLGESNPNLSYLWNISYGNTGYSSTAESPVFNVPYKLKGISEFTICLTIRDVDGCCTEECITIQIGEEVDPPSKLCNFTFCLDDLAMNQCGGSDFYVLTAEDEWYCLSCDDEPEDALKDIINGYMEMFGYDPIQVKIVESSKADCKKRFIIKCWENPITFIPVGCWNKAPIGGGKSSFQPTLNFTIDCDTDCN